jgi:hypothetical protein
MDFGFVIIALEEPMVVDASSTCQDHDGPRATHKNEYGFQKQIKAEP